MNFHPARSAEHINEMDKYMISCDWLQCYCKSHKEIVINNYYYSGKIGPHGYNTAYHITGSKEYNASYKSVYDVYTNKLKLATLLMQPRGLCRQGNACGLKLNNKILYTSDFIFYLYDICFALGLEIVGITRMDLCYDCNYFADGLHPLEFIQRYANVDKTNGISTITRDHSNRFTLIGSKRSDIPTFEYLRFGSRQSAVCCYIYNKSKELEDVKEKPYIRQSWKELGLDDKHVWRTEISISCKGVDMLNIATGDIFRLSPMAIESQSKLEQLWYIYANKYMSFRIVSGCKAHRYYQPIKLFSDENKCQIKPTYVNRLNDSGRRERNAYNVVKEMRNILDDISADDCVALTKCEALMARIGYMKESITEKVAACVKAANWHNLSEIEKDFTDTVLVNPLDYLKITKDDRLPLRTVTNAAMRMAHAMSFGNETLVNDLEVGYIPMLR